LAGVASDEYLSYAEENRKEWERKGHVIVATMLKSYQERHGRTKFGTSVAKPAAKDGMKGGVEQGQNGTDLPELQSSEKTGAKGVSPEFAEQLKRAQGVFASHDDTATQGESTAANTRSG